MIKKIIIRMCEFCIIMCQNCIAAIEMHTQIEAMQKNFKQKIKQK